MLLRRDASKKRCRRKRRYLRFNDSREFGVGGSRFGRSTEATQLLSKGTTKLLDERSNISATQLAASIQHSSSQMNVIEGA